MENAAPYVVLARKWRPQTFEDMTGQEHVVRTIGNAIAQGRVAHAYLFTGPRGVGKTTAARLLAKALNCQSSNGPTAQPCGTCKSCEEITKGISTDVAEIDGASNNGVENVREIREAAKYLPQRDRHKIYIIDEVHMLSTAAFNALLKTLEEPPGHVKFIFATTEPHKVLDTIISRCQRHNFRRVPTADMTKRLRQICDAEGIALSDSSLALVVRQSDGGMRDSLSLLDQIVAACGKAPNDEEVASAIGAVDRKLVSGLAAALVGRQANTVLAKIEEAFNTGVDLKKLTEELALYLRHVVVTRATNNAPDDLAEAERAAVTQLAKSADLTQLTRLFDVVYAAIFEIAKQQPRLYLEMVLLKAVQLAPAASVPELIARVERLAAGAGAGPQGASGGRSPSAPFRSDRH